MSSGRVLPANWTDNNDASMKILKQSIKAAERQFMATPKKIRMPVLVLDNGNRTFDRYTVAFETYSGTILEFSMSFNADSPQGVCQLSNERQGTLQDYLNKNQGAYNHTTGMFQDGELVSLDSLPEGVGRKIQEIARELTGEQCVIVDGRQSALRQKSTEPDIER